MMDTKRYTILDIIRGTALIGMVIVHAIWDLVHIFNVSTPWLTSDAVLLLQQFGSWPFILLSGFCWSLSRKKAKRGLILVLCSAVISLVTAIFMPDSIILFGILSLFGSSMLLMIALDKVFCKIDPHIGLWGCLLLFLITRTVSTGTLGLFGWEIVTLPDALYTNLFTAYLGFLPGNFFSTDYFPLIPWLFLYQTGYFLYRVFEKHNWLRHLSCFSIPPLEWVGRHSLIIYIAHQPILYGIFYLIL